jgi:hypothetical protein
MPDLAQVYFFILALDALFAGMAIITDSRYALLGSSIAYRQD